MLYPVKVIAWSGALNWLSDEKYLKLIYFLDLGKKLDLKNPKAYSEKLQWLKLYDRKPEYVQMVDKYEAKKIVSKILGEQYIIPTIGVYNKFDDVDFKSLPKQFVMKCTHDSGGLVICKDRDKLDINAARKKIQKALKRNYFWFGREWPYKNVKPRIIIEKYMEDPKTHDLKDYKFFTFSGEIVCVLVDYDRFIDHKRAIYDQNWQRLKFTETFQTDYSVEQKCPGNFEEMIKLVRKLVKAIGNPPHVRIDLYTIKNRIYFGEITFFHGSGFSKFDPPEWDEKMGKYINLDEIATRRELRG
ncbi:glycosyl transferase [Candidatus Saccharibacteria bacterium]|nr:glycosyl transferase [Candidatus Saccharibacteria bacterium]